MGWYLALIVAATVTGGEWLAYVAVYYAWDKGWKTRLQLLVTQIERLGERGVSTKGLWSDVDRRENSMILMGSLFIPTAFAILVVGAAPPIPVPQLTRVFLLGVSVFLY